MAGFLRLTFAAALLALPLWLVHATPAHACLCGIDESVTDPLVDLVSKTDIIAIGTIGEMLVLPPESIEHPETLRGRTPVEIKFLVSEFLKGTGARTVLVYQQSYHITYGDGQIAAVSGTDCDLFARFGDQYILFLTKSDPLRYGTYACSGNARISADYDVSSYIADVRAAVARQPVLPGAGAGPPARHSSSSPLVPLLVFAALAVGTSAFFGFRWSRDR